MSEIFSPGSVAGPQGPSGAAGSLANVKCLTDNVLPNLEQLFDTTRIVPNSSVLSDGTLGAAGSSSSPLIYCPGALYAITDIPIRIQPNTYCFALYDANGNFLETLSSFPGVTLVNTTEMPGQTVFSLPGTQTYVRFSWIPGYVNGNYGWTSSIANASFCAGLTAPSIPSPYVPFGFETPGSVNTKIAAVTSNLTTLSSNFARTAIGGGPLSNRNAFNYLDVAPGILNGDGTVSASAGFTTAAVYVPDATSMISNLPIWCLGGPHVCTFDVNGNFIADITDTFAAYLQNSQLRANTVVPLPGNQTYLKFSLNSNYGSYGWAGSAQSAVLYAGTAASPPPSAITALNQSSPFSGNPSPNVRTASSLGASPAQDMNTTAVLNAFLATASATNPIKLILDGMFLVDGLVISPNGYTTIEGTGLGSGIMIIDGSPQDGIRIGAYTSSVGSSEGAYNITAPARTATNVVLRDFTVNLNTLTGLFGGGQTDASANQPASGDPAHSTHGVVLANCTNATLDNVTITRAATYALLLTNASFVKVLNCNFPSQDTIHDGIHIDGPSEDIGIVNCDFSTGDDAIALNAPEGFGGDITRVTVTNCRFHNSLTVMRIYTSIDVAQMPSNNVHRVRQVAISNCVGTTSSMCFDLGITNGVTPTSDVEQLVDFSVDNCSFTSPLGLACLLTPMGSMNFRSIVFAPSGTSAVINGSPTSVARLCVDGLVIRRNSDANSAPTAIVGTGGGTLGTVVLRNIAVVDTPGTSYTAIGALVSTAVPIGALDLDGIDMTQIAALVDSNGYGNVTKIRGGGVIGTGAQVPDSVMDNNAVYLSSNASGAPSIKVGGTAKRLTLA